MGSIWRYLDWRLRISHLARDLGLFGVFEHPACNGCVNPHRRFSARHQGQIFVEPVRSRAWRAILFQQTDIKRDRFVPLGSVNRWVPAHIEPGCAEGVKHGAEKCHVLTPTGLTAERDSVNS